MEGPEAGVLGELRRAGRPEGGRRPSAAVLTCVDARVVPEEVIGCGPGRLYSVRLAAFLAFHGR